MSSTSGRSRRAMTLIELVLATALASLLLAALTGVLSGVAKQTAAISDRRGEEWQMRLISLIRRDLMSADSIWFSSETFWIEGDSPSYGQDQGGDREVGYRCSPLDESRTVLERIDRSTRSVLSVGPNRIRVERLDSSGVPQPLPTQPGPVPGQIRVWIWSDGLPEPEFVRDLIVR